MNTSQSSVLAGALALFDELVDLPPAERQRRIAEIATGNEHLAAEVRRLLAADDDQSGVLDHGVDGIAHTLLTELATPQRPEQPGMVAGSQVGTFTVQRQLGSGGMGEVWLAERRDGSFVQAVALKLLKRGMDSEDIARRFVRERRILAELNHPHVAGFIDGGVHSDGRLFYAMEYVDGTPINEYVRVRSMSVRECVQLLVVVCEAVAYAQAHLVVHRDLKPSNILVDSNGQPRVLDFGIAKLVGESVADTALTSSGMRLLSPAYAAPEQILDEPISTATDVYALGMVGFELLTGELPLQRSSSIITLAEQVREERIPTPSAVLRRRTQHSSSATGNTSARAARELSGDLDVVVLTALQSQPSRRYENAAALAVDLKRWLDGRPISAQADTASYRMRKFVARHRLAVGSASAVLLALIAGLGLALWQAGIAREQAELARMQAERAEAQTRVAEVAGERAARVKDFMMQTFVQADPLQRGENAPTTVAEAFEQAVMRVDEELGNDPALQIDVLDDFSEIRAGQGRFEEARVLNGRALALAERLYPADHPVIAEALVNRAAIEGYSAGDSRRISDDLDRAVGILEQHADTQPTQLANALNALASSHQQAGDSELVLPMFERSAALWRQHGKSGDEGLAAVLHNMSSALLDAGRYDEAEPIALEALQAMIGVGGENTPRLEPMLNVLTQIQYRRGDLDLAAATLRRRLKLAEDNFPDAHPWKASVLTEMGQQLMDSDPEEAARTLDAAIAMYRSLGSARVLMPLRYRALVARSTTGIESAIAYFDQGLDECARRELDHLMCDLIRANRAGLIAQRGDGEAALREVQAAMDSMEKRDAKNDNEYAQALESMALAENALGRKDAAIATQSSALDRYVALFGEQHTEVARARANLEKLR